MSQLAHRDFVHLGCRSALWSMMFPWNNCNGVNAVLWHHCHETSVHHLASPGFSIETTLQLFIFKATCFNCWLMWHTWTVCVWSWQAMTCPTLQQSQNTASKKKHGLSTKLPITANGFAETKHFDRLGLFANSLYHVNVKRRPRSTSSDFRSLGENTDPV
jgi:hypothetical protein